MKNQKAVIVFSGGQDSTTCLYWAIAQWGKNIEAITFNYGQKHSIEIQKAKLICEKEGIKQTIIDISFLDQIVESALTSNGNVNETNSKGLPASFVPNRNQLFITLAHSYAQKINAQHLVLGVCETDFSGYPDCRLEFINAIGYATNLGSDADIHIHTPLMYLNKCDTWWLADRLGCIDQVKTMSHTCYNGNEQMNEYGAGCGECPACKLRAAGYTQYKLAKEGMQPITRPQTRN